MTNHKTVHLIAATLFLVAVLACAKAKAENSINNKTTTENSNKNMASTINVKIGSSTFKATLSNNASAAAFKKLLPLTITMNELNNNEKYFDFSNALPVNASNPDTINSGDLMRYGSKTLVLFYKNFSTSYSYSKLGHIDDPKGLKAALGARNVSVTFEAE